MEKDIRVNYDALCYATFINVKTLSSGIDRICLEGFDYKDKEHKFVLSVIIACWSILGERDVAVDCDFITRLRLNWQYRKVCRFRRLKKEKETINVRELLDYMRSAAKEALGDDFSFGEIYDAYYNKGDR